MRSSQEKLANIFVPLVAAAFPGGTVESMNTSEWRSGTTILVAHVILAPDTDYQEALNSFTANYATHLTQVCACLGVPEAHVGWLICVDWSPYWDMVFANCADDWYRRKHFLSLFDTTLPDPSILSLPKNSSPFFPSCTLYPGRNKVGPRCEQLPMLLGGAKHVKLYSENPALFAQLQKDRVAAWEQRLQNDSVFRADMRAKVESKRQQGLSTSYVIPITSHTSL